MKKTITLLLATAGLAVAASDPLDITWDADNKASLQSPLDAISVVFTLDLTQLTAPGLYKPFQTPIFQWDGIDEYGDVKGGVEHYYEDDPGYAYINGIEGFYNGSGIGRKSIIGFTEAIVGYTYGTNQKSKFYLTLIDAQGVGTNYEPVEGGKTRAQLDITNLTKHTGIGEIEVYDSVLSADEITSAMKGMAAAPAVPEPTTATLSLLALAGLAARRRRK